MVLYWHNPGVKTRGLWGTLGTIAIVIQQKIIMATHYDKFMALGGDLVGWGTTKWVCMYVGSVECVGGVCWGTWGNSYIAEDKHAHNSLAL